MEPNEEFRQQVAENIVGLGRDRDLKALSLQWLERVSAHRYPYNFTWLGRPIIQVPQDMVAMQELVWLTRPDLVIETGVAHGGSLILHASMLALLDYCDAAAAGTPLDPRTSRRRVIGVDIDIRAHNRSAIEAHPLSGMIELIQGSSVDQGVVARVRDAASGYAKVMVVLDSNHTHQHVLDELEAYAPLTSVGSYCVVFDTLIEDMPDSMFHDRPWKRGNSPKSAVHEYLRLLASDGRTAADGARLAMQRDTDIDNKLLLTVAPDGFLKRIG
jgi:cephalosporin hydroxylase